MREIPLTRDLVAIVDDEDFERASAFKWYAQTKVRRGGRTVHYATRNIYKPKHTTIGLHNFLMPLPRGLEVDHIDGNGLNNRRSNLRPATRLQNLCARRYYTPPSGYRGVYKTPGGRWCAELKIHGRKALCKTFDTAIEAATARDLAALEHHGQFAWLNFPELRTNAARSPNSAAISEVDRSTPSPNGLAHQGGRRHV